jgi:hypothetical protein
MVKLFDTHDRCKLCAQPLSHEGGCWCKRAGPAFQLERIAESMIEVMQILDAQRLAAMQAIVKP